MLINEILAEHSDWAQLNYTERELYNLHLAVRAVQAGYIKRGVGIKFSKHFFDQMKLDRGIKKKYTPDTLFLAFKRILPVIKQTFEQDPDEKVVFYDPDTKINVAMVMNPDGTFLATTTIRATKFIGPGHKVTV